MNNIAWVVYYVALIGVNILSISICTKNLIQSFGNGYPMGLKLLGLFGITVSAVAIGFCVWGIGLALR